MFGQCGVVGLAASACAQLQSKDSGWRGCPALTYFARDGDLFVVPRMPWVAASTALPNMPL